MKQPLVTTKELVIMAALTAVLLLQKQLLTFLPNVTLNFFLILLYTKCLGLGRTAAIVTVYLLLDSILWGSLNPIFTTAQWIGWMAGPFITTAFLKKTEDSILLSFANAGFAFLYSWVMIVPTAFVYTNQMRTLWAYILSDIPWELMLAASAFIPTLFLYEPLAGLLRSLWRKK